MMWRNWILVAALTALLGRLEPCLATPPESDEPPPRVPANLAVHTLGGPQFWADELVFHNWRIQRNVYTGHCRLLDDRDVRQCWGTFEACRDALEEAKRVHDLPPLSRRVVLTLHGMIRTRGAMEPMGDYLSMASDFEVMHVGYPSTRANLAAHAGALASVVKHLEGVEEINFVAHSLGGLVVRRYLADAGSYHAESLPDPRIRRIVMLGTPNHGSRLAATFKDNPLLAMVWGKSAQELAGDWQVVSRSLAVPACEFGIIAGKLGTNPLLPGESDLVITLEEAKLEGARDFLVAPVSHTNLRVDPKVCEYTLRFLERGHFVSEEARRPLSPKPAQPAKTRASLP